MTKRILILFCLTSLLNFHANSQGLIPDALELRRHIVDTVDEALNNGDDIVYKILKKYFPGEAATKTTIVNVFDGAGNNPADPNPFINFSGGPQAEEASTMVNAAASPGSIAKSLAASIGGLDVTTIADGLAKFLVERTKQELSVAFFDDFQKKISDPKYADLEMLFPQTTQLLKNIGTDIYQFSTYLQALREAFMQDLNNLFSTFPQVINQPKYDPFFNSPELKYVRPALNSALYITMQLKNKVHPVKIISDFPVDVYFPYSSFQNVNGMIKTLQLFSNSLSISDMSTNRQWIPADSLWKLVNDNTAFKLYLGLVYQQAASVKFAGGTSLQDIFKSIADNREGIRKYAEFVITLFERASTVESFIKELKDKKKEDISYADYYNYFNSVIDLFKVFGFSDALTRLQDKVDPIYNRFLFIATNVNNISLSISQKNYSSAVMNIVTAFDTLLQPVYNHINASQPAASTNTAAASVNSLPLVDKYSKFRAALMKYGAFMAQVSSAKTSDDVKKAIESAALPVGSASIKKHASFNIALNAYVGPFYGRQKMASDKDFVNAGGMYSPVGVSFSTGIGSSKNPGSISLFTSLIDIGALTTFRFSNPNDSLSGDIKIKLSQIVAPGVHLIFGVPKWPISFGGGYQWSPLLSKVEQSAATLNDSKGKRWQLFMAVDLPLLNFYNKSR